MDSHRRRQAVPTAPCWLVLALLPCAVAAQGGGVRLSIELRAESPDAYRAWRRAQGLDPPATACEPPRSLSQAAARRMLRTYVLDDNGQWRPLQRGDLAQNPAAPCAPGGDDAH